MHSIIKLHIMNSIGNYYPVYVFVDKIVDFKGDDLGSYVVLVSNNDYDKTLLFVEESPKEILDLIAEAEAAEINDLMS